MKNMSEQERFDSLLDRMRMIAYDELLGTHTRTLQMGQVAVRYAVFTPREGQPEGYKPSIQFQDLVEDEAHNGLYWAPVSEIYLRSDKLDRDGTAEKLTELEAKLDLFEKILDFRAEAGG